MDIKDLPKIKFLTQPESFGCRIVGEVYQQVTPFEWHEHDWNCDNDVYAQKIAGFEKLTNENPHSPNYFYLSEHDFNELRHFKNIEYVKESRSHPSLDEALANAGARNGNAGKAQQNMKTFER